MIGRSLLVRVTYVHADGSDAHTQFVGTVISVSPQVSVSKPGSSKPFLLPPDPKCYGTAPPGAYKLEPTGETVFNPRYQTTWTVRAPSATGRDPKSASFRPAKN